jgi:hypothetical protein
MSDTLCQELLKHQLPGRSRELLWTLAGIPRKKNGLFDGLQSGIIDLQRLISDGKYYLEE